MRTIRIRIRHDDDFVVIAILDFEIRTDPCTDRVDDRVDFLVFQYILHARAFRIDDFAAQRKYRLELTVAPLFGGSTGGITLDQIQFVLFRIFALRRRQLAGQQRFVFLPFFAVTRFFTGFTRCISCLSGFQGFSGKHLGCFAIFGQIDAQFFADESINGCPCLRGA
ncbi:hypothetical protein SDC9_122193 [bioreactor metagenome]|uniref:Uncharacterized protein n=1 Tax=bioreactor metagenome TaxID=1076179 RepID=A0A645CEB3_9ZZZZ